MPSSLVIGDNPPDFQKPAAEVTTGQAFKLSDHLGKVIVLAFVSWG